MPLCIRFHMRISIAVWDGTWFYSGPSSSRPGGSFPVSDL